MKRIVGISAAPEGLLRFRADPGAANGWDEFGSFEAGAAKRELTRALVTAQHGLCAYCEIRLLGDDTQIEHFVPRSDPASGAHLALDERNLMAACKGGSNPNFAQGTMMPDSARFHPPVAKNLSCGAAKGNKPVVNFIDPRGIPAQPPVVRIDSEGFIDLGQGSASTGLSGLRIKDHVNGLGLNVPRLRIARAAVYAELSAAYEELESVSEADRDAGLRQFAESRLLPDAAGGLAQFFTTPRSFFGPLAECILERQPQTWI